MKLAIVGSQSLTVSETEDAYFWVELLLSSTPDLSEAVSGGCPTGVDFVLEAVAEDLGIPAKIFRPDIYKWESEYIDDVCHKGFKDRNIEVGDYCDRLVCIRSVRSKTYGSGWTADYTEGLGKDVKRMFIGDLEHRGKHL